MRNAGAVRHRKNPHFIGISVMHENGRANFADTIGCAQCRSGAHYFRPAAAASRGAYTQN
jgi:hypothetical protein